VIRTKIQEQREGGGQLSQYNDCATGWTMCPIAGRSREGNFSLRHCVQTYPAFYTMRTGDFFHTVKWPRRESEHSPPTTAKIKNACSYTSTSSLCLYSLLHWIYLHKNKVMTCHHNVRSFCCKFFIEKHYLHYWTWQPLLILHLSVTYDYVRNLWIVLVVFYVPTVK
jgi:hypothetical protein